MRKSLIIALTLTVCMMLSPHSTMASEGISYDNIKLLYVGPYLSYTMGLGTTHTVENVPTYILPLMSQRPFIKDGRAYLPLRLTFHILGYMIDWKSDEDNMTIYNDTDTMILDQSSQEITVDGRIVDMSLLLINGSYFVPLRALAAASGDAISWDDETRTIVYVRKGSQLLLPPVTITDIKYKIDNSREYEHSAISMIIRNTSGETIPQHKLWYIINNRYTTQTADETMMRYGIWAAGYPINEGEELRDGQMMTQSTFATMANAPRFESSGAYVMYTLGNVDNDPYMRRIDWVPPLP